MHNLPPNVSCRSLERICKEQAAMTTDEATRRALLAMAAEYRRQAERQEPPKE
jgi:hypothetical protein